MKVKDANVGLLTNLEVLDFLRSRGADQEDSLSATSLAAPSEVKVYEYLKQSSAGTQTRENVEALLEKVAEYKLTKAEILQVVNLRPSRPVEVHLIVKDCEERMSSDEVDQFVEDVEQTLPPPPGLVDEEGEAVAEDMEATDDVEEEEEEEEEEDEEDEEE